MSFLITGDTHGILDIDKVVRFFDEHEGEYEEVEGQFFCLYEDIIKLE